MPKRDSTRADDRPSVQWYPKDYLNDPLLSMCGLAAQGLWMRMLCLMWVLPHRGKLAVEQTENGVPTGKMRPITQAELSRLLSISEAECQAGLNQILAYRVASVDSDGIVYSRRIVKDEAIRQTKARAGSIGGSKQKASKTEAECQAKGEAKEGSSTSASSPAAASTATNTTTTDTAPTGKQPPVVAPVRMEPDLEKRVWLGVTDKDRAFWAKAYPACDISIELSKAIEWLLANPSKRKSQYRRFLNGWLNRCQDRGGTRKGVASGEQQGSPNKYDGIGEKWNP